MPSGCVSNRRRLSVSKPAPTSKTRETHACSATKDFCEKAEWSRVARAAERIGSAGWVREAIHAGAALKTRPVSSERTKANPNTAHDGAASTGTYSALANASWRMPRVATIATHNPATPPKSASKTRSEEHTSELQSLRH